MTGHQRKAEQTWQERRGYTLWSLTVAVGRFCLLFPNGTSEEARETAGPAEQPAADWEAENTLLVIATFTCGQEMGQGITGQ